MPVSTFFGAALGFFAGAASPTHTDVQLDGEPLPHNVWHASVMPGETLDLDLPDGAYAEIDGKRLDAPFVAPQEAGDDILKVRSNGGAVIAKLTVFTLEPASRMDSNRALNGYKIGTYPANAPEGYIRFEPGDEDLPVSPNFKLGQFLCKQQPDHFPKYLLVSPPNLKRLEHLLATLRADELTESVTFFVMSGYRTPFYNTAIGSARLSRHMYGDAADIYLDVKPRDGQMDDLNNDGEITKADADFLYDYAARLFANSDLVEPGGIGSYNANAYHGPFVHVDGRGTIARWGR